MIRASPTAELDVRFFADAASGAPLDRSPDAAGPALMLVFNAAMIPGWPPPRPFEMPDAEAMLAKMMDGTMLADREDDIAGRLGAPAMRRLRRLPRSRRLRASLGLLALADTIDALIDAIEAELLELSRMRQDDEDWAGAHRRVTA